MEISCSNHQTLDHQTGLDRIQILWIFGWTSSNHQTSLDQIQIPLIFRCLTEYMTHRCLSRIWNWRSIQIKVYYCWLVWCERKILFWFIIHDRLRPSDQEKNTVIFVTKTLIGMSVDIEVVGICDCIVFQTCHQLARVSEICFSEGPSDSPLLL